MKSVRQRCTRQHSMPSPILHRGPRHRRYGLFTKWECQMVHYYYGTQLSLLSTLMNQDLHTMSGYMYISVLLCAAPLCVCAWCVCEACCPCIGRSARSTPICRHSAGLCVHPCAQSVCVCVHVYASRLPAHLCL